MNKRESDKRYKFLIEKINKGRSEGLTLKDYIEIKHMQDEIDPFLALEDEELSSFYYELEILKKAIVKEGLFYKFSEENIDYIKSNSMLLPLVLANDEEKKIKITGDNGYLFKCQFHEDKKPSMLVRDFKNDLFCYGCHSYKNAISYLQAHEKLLFNDAIKLLSQIYLYDVKSIDRRLINLVKKYRKSLLSGKYQEFLEVGYERMRSRNNESNSNIDEIYNQRFATIKRVRENEYDENFKYEEPRGKVYLK